MSRGVLPFFRCGMKKPAQLNTVPAFAVNIFLYQAQNFARRNPMFFYQSSRLYLYILRMSPFVNIIGRHVLVSVIRFPLQQLMVIFVNIFLNLLRRGQIIADRDIVVHGVDDDGQELAHIRFQVPGLLQQLGRAVI